jgi:hypothetical protein
MRMTDQQFLWWVHERLVYQHGNHELMDYMHRLRSIIDMTHPDRVTPTMTNDPGPMRSRFSAVPFTGNPRGEKCP